MAKKNNKICIICSSPYSYCPTCGSDHGKPSWYSIFDGENCKDIYDICTSYRDGIYDKKAAYDKISKCDISGLKDFNPVTKAQIEDILSYKENKVTDEVKPVEKKIATNTTSSFKKNK